MRKIVVLALVALAAFALVGCQTISDVANAVGAVKSATNSASASASAAAPVEFKSGEILCSEDAGTMFNAGFYLAKVQTPASEASKGQAQIIWIEGGKTAWVNYAVESRKATKDDLKVGTPVFFPAGWGNHDEISSDSYRKATWYLGRVTDTTDLFKNRVEVNGDAYNWTFLRVPTSPVK